MQSLVVAPENRLMLVPRSTKKLKDVETLRSVAHTILTTDISAIPRTL